MPSLHVLSAAEGSAVAVHFTRSPDHPILSRSFPVAGQFAARSDWQADLGDFKRAGIEMYEQSRLMGGEARRPIGEQAGRQARRHKASPVNFPSMTRRYLPLTELEWNSVFLGYWLS